MKPPAPDAGFNEELGMNYARRLAACAATMVAAAGLASGSASAATLTMEGGGLCPAVTVADHSVTAGCHLVASSPAGNPVELRGLFGTMYLCDSQFEVRLNGNGEGYIYNQVLRTPGTLNNCSIQPQNEAESHKKPWPGEVVTENGCGAGCDTMETVFSVTGAFGILANCHLGLELRQTSHTAGQVKTQGTTHVFCENDASNAVLGVWNVVAEGRGVEVQ